jgi:hypothetical protein
VQPPTRTPAGNLGRRLCRYSFRIAAKIFRAVEKDSVRDARHTDLATVVRVALAQHRDRLGPKRLHPTSHRLGRSLPGHAEQQCDFHVRSLTRGRLFHRCCVFMSIDEDEAGGTAHIADRRNGTKQDRTVATV